MPPHVPPPPAFWWAKPAALLTTVGLISMCTRHIPELSQLLIFSSATTIQKTWGVEEEKEYKSSVAFLSILVSFPFFSQYGLVVSVFALLCHRSWWLQITSPSQVPATQCTTLCPLTTLIASFYQPSSVIWWFLFICWTCVLASSCALSLDRSPVSIEIASLTLPSESQSLCCVSWLRKKDISLQQALK